MSLEHSAARQPRTVIRLARLNEFFGLKKSQMDEVVKQLVEKGWLTKPFNPAGGLGRSKVVWGDEVAAVQQRGVEAALAAAAKDEEDDDQ
jgi:hypothetical protein